MKHIDSVQDTVAEETPTGDPGAGGVKKPAAGQRLAPRGRRPDSEGARAIATIDVPVASYKELRIGIDDKNRAMWCRLDPVGPPSFTPTMVAELNDLHRRISSLKTANADCPLQYYIMGSAIPSIYNLGGDLNFMIDAIKNRDAESLTSYAHGCVHAVYGIYTGFSLPIVSVCLVEGDALGGGLEGAICFNTIVAERGSKMGLPEILFGSFPGMGAFSFLSRKLDVRSAEQMIRSGKIYTAEEFYEMGLVDILAEKGQGVQAVNAYLRENAPRHRLNLALVRAKQRLNPLTLEELLEITDIWVETALALDLSDLRRMELLAKAQTRRLQA